MQSRTSILCITLLTAGCASAGPTPDLIDARRAYDDARRSPAAQYSPDKLLSAKQALQVAESAHAEDPGSFEEKSLAYVAQRRAQYANVYGSYEKDRREQAEVAQAYRDMQDELRRRAERQARNAESDAERAQRELANQRSQVEQGKAALALEKQARAKAEQSAAAAVASLSKIAQIKEEQRGVVITLDGQVLFVSGKAELLPIARDRLNEVAKSLKELDDDKQVTVEGFTDSRGADDTNLKLSQARADAVRDYLVSQGVKPEKIRSLGRGEANPIASNDTPEGRANNRRVELVVQSGAQAAAARTERP